MAKFEQQKKIPLRPLCCRQQGTSHPTPFCNTIRQQVAEKRDDDDKKKGFKRDREERKSRQSSISRVCKKSATTVYSIKLFRLSLSFLVGTALMRTEVLFFRSGGFNLVRGNCVSSEEKNIGQISRVRLQLQLQNWEVFYSFVFL